MLTRNKLHEFEVNFFSQISAQAIVTHKQLKFNSGVWYPCKPHVGSSAEGLWILQISSSVAIWESHYPLSIQCVQAVDSTWFSANSDFLLNRSCCQPSPSCSFLSPSSFLVLGLCFLFTFGFVSLSLSLFLLGFLAVLLLL